MESTHAILDIGDPLYELAWPRAVLTAELDRQLLLASRQTVRNQRWPDQIARLLRTAFRSSVVVDEFYASVTHLGDPFGPPTLTDPAVAWVRQLRAEVQGLPELPVTRRYYTARRGQPAGPADQAEAMRRFVAVVRELDTDGLWAERLGTDCPDGIGDPPEPPNDLFRRLLGRNIVDADGPWPLNEHRVDGWILDDFFDLVEVLHDLASWPGTWDSHNFGGCIGHPGSFSQSCGQAVYRWKVNEVLRGSNLGVVIADAGEDRGRVALAIPATTEAIVEAALERSDSTHASEVAHAIALFRSRNRDVPTLRSAVVTLAGVLEAHRSLLKLDMLTNDENALFDIANNFDLRHRNAKQRTDVDPVFLEWVFGWYLSTVTLVTSLRERQSGSP